MDKETTPEEPRLDEDLPVEDESAEQVTGGHSERVSNRFSNRHTNRKFNR